MRTKLVLGLILIASFVVANLHSSGRSYTPDGYCHYVPATGICLKTQAGVVCYGVFADCTYME